MDTHPDITALRGCVAPQRNIQSAMMETKAAWSEMIDAKFMAELSAFSNGTPLSQCVALNRLLAVVGDAHRIVDDIIARCLAVLEKEPLAIAPFRHQFQGGIGVIQLAISGNAALSLVMYERAADTMAQTVCFTDSDCHELVLRGSARGRIISIAETEERAVELTRSALILERGKSVSVIGRGQAKLLDCIDENLVVLRLSRSPQHPFPTREYSLATSRLIHSASGNRSESQHELWITLLGAMERVDAAPILADIVAENHGDTVRWQALRQALGLDTAIGMEALRQASANTCDSLSNPAISLLGQLESQLRKDVA